MAKSARAPRNRTMRLTPEEEDSLSRRLLYLERPATVADVENRTICQDAFQAVEFLPDQFVDLLFLDPPYNLNKSFNGRAFRATPVTDYQNWLDSWLPKFRRLLKPAASIYICGDWRSSAAIHVVAAKYFTVRNRITWEREKGRGATANWKNCSEDIWFCTVSEDYTFNLNAVKIRRRVIAPYTDENGDPRDWERAGDGNYRLTHPSNLWTDVTVPFWSMPENTVHPTQKPEKLLAKIILASSNPQDLVLDPFLGSGTTSVVAKKLQRKFVGIEIDRFYCCLAEKRLQIACTDNTIQGYQDGVFWERNSYLERHRRNRRLRLSQSSLFEDAARTGVTYEE